LKSKVLNTSIDTPESLNFMFPQLKVEQEREIIAGLFEQLLIFDEIFITANRLNFALTFLIKTLGINTVERLLRAGYIKLMIWTPVVVTGAGQQLEDGTLDESTIYGQPPIAAAALSENDIDPEKHINSALQLFNFHRDRKRIFTRLAIENYIVPNGMSFSKNSADLVIESYKNNNLLELGLPYTKEPNQLDKDERMKLLNLSSKIIETAVLSEYSLKSYENYDHYQICRQNLANIGKAYNITENSSTLFKLEGLPNLRKLFLDEKMPFDSVFKIRHISNAKYYRRWINDIGENVNGEEITREYLNEIKGGKKFFETSEGKFLKNLGLFSANTILGQKLAGFEGALAGYSLGLLETYWLDNLLKGHNPSMFIDLIKKESEYVDSD